jgi:predicted nucleic acid-binding protein
VVFIDSNVWLYGYTDEVDDSKRSVAIRLAALQDVCLSSQVINEVISNILKAGLRTEIEARRLIDGLYSDYVVMEILREDIQVASELREEYRFSYWDSLIVATALRAKAEILYSEDMQDGLKVRGRMTIRNPFR